MISASHFLEQNGTKQKATFIEIPKRLIQNRAFEKSMTIAAAKVEVTRTVTLSSPETNISNIQPCMTLKSCHDSLMYDRHMQIDLLDTLKSKDLSRKLDHLLFLRIVLPSCKVVWSSLG